MFKLKVVQASHGDSFILEYGSTGDSKYMLIDGGPRGAYKNYLKRNLEYIRSQGGEIDIAVVSHVDSDHIVGIIDLLVDNELQVVNGTPEIIKVKELWLNSFSDTLNDSTHANDVRFMNIGQPTININMKQTLLSMRGIQHGRDLRLKALRNSVLLNDGFLNNTIMVDDSPVVRQFSNLEVHIIGPLKKNLDELKLEWIEWLEQYETAVSSADPFLLANSDSSVPNLSSIMFVAKAHGKSILFTGDGRGDHIIDGLDQANLLTSGKAHFDILKVAHHGSNRNATKSFFKKITADLYIISAHGHPDKPDLSTLIWIVEAAKEQNRQIEIFATNQDPDIDKLKEEYPEVEYGYTILVMNRNFHYKDFELSP